MNLALWIIASLLATVFLLAGSTKLFIPRAKLARAQLLDAGGANRQVDVLTVGYLDGNNAHHLSIHIKDRTAAVAM